MLPAKSRSNFLAFEVFLTKFANYKILLTLRRLEFIYRSSVISLECLQSTLIVIQLSAILKHRGCYILNIIQKHVFLEFSRKLKMITACDECAIHTRPSSELIVR
jgi:hypothetical protein